MSLISAISGANGPAPEAYLSHVAIVRGSLTQPQLIQVDFDAVMHGKAPNVPLEPGDIVYVPLSPYRFIADYADLIVTTFVPPGRPTKACAPWWATETSVSACPSGPRRSPTPAVHSVADARCGVLRRGVNHRSGREATPHERTNRLRLQRQMTDRRFSCNNVTCRKPAGLARLRPQKTGCTRPGASAFNTGLMIGSR